MTPPPDPHRRNEQSRQAIVQAAVELCGEVGFDKTTVEAIAARAGVGKQTIYRWWPSKAAVLLEFMKDLRSSRADFPDTGDLRTDLRTQNAALVNLFGSRGGVVWRGLIAAAQSDPVAAAGVREVIDEAVADCSARLAKAVNAGQLRADVDLELVVELVYGPLYHAYLLRPDRIAGWRPEEALDALFSGLQPR
ncbi:TetR/AcrR family transcriptional regulator [Hamadaea tsunoensis]|uniref:TetR/AcrR family transcriptional regulator n=1 Tax=Hamadaea tsunoensis TaxID=53368 RepID=UPI0005548542|nr:TetR/AcrR family transcriptional regulator [Hamadaea tsunoensis]